ncbi:MAG: oligopeptide/dipeptide ABC transporter ATP-binding protein [Candidatus Onthovivens sp.]|nr:oligopeptide/dipeptide ABC transporter ATP-binding protein [Candidatus Onthovivens sp.]
MSEKILSVKDLVVSFKTDRGIVHAVRGVSFDLYKGETLCIVGESGSGKSVTNKAIIGISSANAIIENGQIVYEGEDLVKVSEEEFHRIRGKKIGMIFQDPLSALNPTMRVGKQIMEATLINKNILKKYYEELISKELCEYRNAISSATFDNRKYEEEIKKNKEIVENLKKLEKKELTLEKKIIIFTNKINSLSTTSLNSKDELVKDKKTDKLSIKLSELNNELVETRQDITNIKNDIKKDISLTKKKLENDININDAKIKSIENSIPSLETELKRNIATNQIQKLQKLNGEFSALIEKYAVFTGDFYEFFKIRKIDLKKLTKVNDTLLKSQLPLLKKDLSIRKKEAKKLTKIHKKELIEKKDKELNELKVKLDALKLQLKEYESSLDENKLALIKGVILSNTKKEKQIAKLNNKYKEVNLSKVSKDNKLELDEIPDSKYKQLFEEIRNVEKEIKLIHEEFLKNTKISKFEAKRMALKVMKEVGIPLPERRFRQYPFEFSGGMRQRIVIAIALIANPDILICDEPTTALDVTIQAQILDLINDLKKKRGLSCIFITHDLGVVAHMADRVAVMYAGKIVEYGTVDEIFFEPKHPYTWALLSSIPDINSKEKLESIPGTPPDMLYPPVGDAFALRSKYALDIDFKYEPPFFKVSDTHYAATWLLHKDAPVVAMPKIVEERIKNAKKLDEEMGYGKE